MKKSYIIMGVAFLLFAGGIYGVFITYVMPMGQELAELEKTETEILKKIEVMETAFDGSKPEAYLAGLREQQGPWRVALQQRTPYFQREDVEKIEMPEDVIPRFWYREMFPDLEDSVQQMAKERKITLLDFSFGEKRPEAYGPGTNPSREEILEQVNKYNYGIQMVKFIMDANPRVVKSVVLWPERKAHSGRSGEVTYRTTGYEISIMWDDLMQFLQRLSNRSTYVTVEAIKITDSTLRFDRDPVEVQLIITEAQFVPSQVGIGGTEGGGSVSAFGGGTSLPLGGGFGRRGASAQEEEKKEESGGIIDFLKGLVGL